MKLNYSRAILALDDNDLEGFVHSWISKKTETYKETKRWSGPGDLGRDVVGYLTDQKHDGDWDNYQCKQLQKKLNEAGAFLELGKIFMHVANGKYSLPRRYYFIAPKGVARAVDDYIGRPLSFKQACIDNWKRYCENRLVSNKAIPLSPDILEKINTFSFEHVYALDAAGISKDPHAKPVLVDWFDDDPGEAPHGTVPPTPTKQEATYIGQLVAAYNEREKVPIKQIEDISKYERWDSHLKTQRYRYYDAEEFNRYYRDTVSVETLNNFKNDIYYGVIDTYYETHKDTVDKINAVMLAASTVVPSGILTKYARVTARQGTCHHFANEGKMPWKQK